MRVGACHKETAPVIDHNTSSVEPHDATTRRDLRHCYRGENNRTRASQNVSHDRAERTVGKSAALPLRRLNSTHRRYRVHIRARVASCLAGTPISWCRATSALVMLVNRDRGNRETLLFSCDCSDWCLSSAVRLSCPAPARTLSHN